MIFAEFFVEWRVLPLATYWPRVDYGLLLDVARLLTFFSVLPLVKTSLLDAFSFVLRLDFAVLAVTGFWNCCRLFVALADCRIEELLPLARMPV